MLSNPAQVTSYKKKNNNNIFDPSFPSKLLFELPILQSSGKKHRTHTLRSKVR
jgi:hypothetical protein